jgi:hypothetical protein
MKVSAKLQPGKSGKFTLSAKFSAQATVNGKLWECNGSLSAKGKCIPL